MKFTDIQYEKPNLEAITKQLEKLIESFSNATTANEQVQLMKEIQVVRNEFESNRTIVSIRHSINTKDEYYDTENKFFDENSPAYGTVVSKYYKAVVDSDFKSELSKEFGEHFLNLAQTIVESFDDKTVDLLKEENKLTSEYSVLIAQLEIEVDGKKYSLSNISPLLSSSDRSVRKISAEALYSALAAQQVKLDELYHELIQLRHKIATTMGYDNYVELGYKKLKRTDYSADDVAEYRKAIAAYVVPVVKKLKQRQKARLGLDDVKYYDAGFKFKSGNPTPKGGPDWIIKNGAKMYQELSPETHEFFQFMQSNNLLDVEAKEGKMAGGYCTFIGKYGYPFIFSNFNGTSHDIDVLTHEAGHAFQVFRSRTLPLAEYYFPTLEACEIHSMSMEFFTHPWMETFFEEDVDKYKFSHLSAALSFLPYGVAIDEFQHFVYENPNISIAERNAEWLKIEEKYDLASDKDGNEYLLSGRMWQKQGHLYKVPFYYIDYTLAQVCAFQFWERCKFGTDNEKQGTKEAWDDYLNLCNKGGSLPFTKLVEVANLKSPFVTENLKGVVERIDNYLEGIDDSKM